MANSGHVCNVLGDGRLFRKYILMKRDKLYVTFVSRVRVVSMVDDSRDVA